jgi:hypothetical protein
MDCCHLHGSSRGLADGRAQGGAVLGGGKEPRCAQAPGAAQDGAQVLLQASGGGDWNRVGDGDRLVVGTAGGSNSQVIVTGRLLQQGWNRVADMEAQGWAVLHMFWLTLWGEGQATSSPERTSIMEPSINTHRVSDFIQCQPHRQRSS